MISKALALLLGLAFCAPLGAEDIAGIDIDGPFVRIQRNDDGTRTVYERGYDKRTLTKRTYNAKNNVIMTATYRLDGNGNPVKCDIYDVMGNRIYKTSFGYSKKPGPTLGKLVQERLYDVRTPNWQFDKNGKKIEAPIHIIYYPYGPDGKALQPVGETLIKGKRAEEVFGGEFKSQVLPRKMSELEPANPNAEPLKR